MQPTIRNRFILAFDFKPPMPSNELRSILFIHSASVEQSKKSLLRLMTLYPNADFYVLKRQDVSISKIDLKRVSWFNYSSDVISEDFLLSDDGRKLAETKIDLLFFSINRVFLDMIDYKKQYGNIVTIIRHLGYLDISYFIDKDYMIFSLAHFNGPIISSCIKGEILHLPVTFLTEKERVGLFDLASSGPSKGNIVNIGHFLGGSSILLARGSKKSRREKVFSFDIERYNWDDSLLRKNKVDNLVCFEKIKSEDAAREWSRRKANGIRLLFIDGSHKYNDCKNDILNWSQFVVPGGLIAVHDYCNAGTGLRFSSVVEAVYDTLLNNTGFNDFRRVETIFIASKS